LATNADMKKERTKEKNTNTNHSPNSIQTKTVYRLLQTELAE